MPNYTTSEINTTGNENSTSSDSPPPSSFSNCVKLSAESITAKELELSEQQFNIYSTVIQQPLNVDFKKNAYNPDIEIDSEPQHFIQHITKDEGEREVVEQSQSDDVLQNEQVVNLSTTQIETSSQTNPRDPITS